MNSLGLSTSILFIFLNGLKVFIILKFTFYFFDTLFCAFFFFLSSSLLSFKYLYVFALNQANYVMICPSNSSFTSPITFLLFPLGNDLSVLKC